MTHTQIDVIIGTIQTSEQQVITERELARVVGCERTALANVRERHSDRFTVLDAEKSAINQLVKKCDRFILTLKIQAEDGKMREQICYSPLRFNAAFNPFTQDTAKKTLIPVQPNHQVQINRCLGDTIDTF